ncbi:SH3 domain-containing protein [Mariprofundus ferrinatatus]|nr:SH3 domain-containing protein [Mariprofundus ferrinatatus]
MMLPGCVALTAVSAIPGALFEVAANQFIGKEKSYPANMRKTLTGVQQSLQSLKLDVDVLEIQQDGGYGIGFGNERLDGEITLRTQTPELTTVYIKVKGSSREESVEHAIIEVIDEKLKRLPASAHMDTSKYNNLRQDPSVKSPRVGWFRPGASLEVTQSGAREWLKIKLPSGDYAYLKGAIKEGDPAQKRKTILSKSE